MIPKPAFTTGPAEVDAFREIRARAAAQHCYRSPDERGKLHAVVDAELPGAFDPVRELRQRALEQACYAQELGSGRDKSLPCVRVEVLDPDQAGELSQLRRTSDVVTLVSALEGPTVVHAGERELYRLTPMPAGTVPTAHLSLDELQAIVADPAIGHDDDGAMVSAEFAAEGRTAAEEVLRHRPEPLGLHAWERTAEAYEAMAVAVGRSWGLSYAALSEILGRTVAVGRLVLPPCSEAERLSRQRAAERAEAEAAIALVQARAEPSKPNTRTLAQRGLLGLVIQAGEFVQVPRELALRRRYVLDGETIIVLPAVVGLVLPAGAMAVGARVLDPSFVLAVTAREIEVEASKPVTNDEYTLVRRLHALLVPDVDRGPIASFAKGGIAQGKALAQAHAGDLYSPRTGRQWVLRHIVECLVRGFLVAPPRAVGIVFDAQLSEHEARHPPRMLPKNRRPAGSIGAWDNLAPGEPENKLPMSVAEMEPDPEWVSPTFIGDREQLGIWAAEFARAGEIEPGCLLAPQTKSKKAK